ncbi:UDP-galactopyranose mutase [Nitrosospira multiformis]|uniref:UDP-galactopyranose mutase n=1 Tax=Nitrosospira multiformis TaxID=1231 RepID=A0A1H8EZZ8_9PROT|nr:NAD(P)-binding protein [Nitrosospira multiformis]SEN25082.1 UDP-galactopyranose mutase [Nitrosospira multiformis]
MNAINNKIFLSFWQAGYEGSDHINGEGVPLSMNHATQHADLAYHDYSLLRDFGIGTVRESVGWRSVEKEGRFDFSSVELRAHAARDLGLQVIWTLCHYGWPDEIDPCSADFIDRFSLFCSRTVEYLESFSTNDVVSIYTPINEISFTSWVSARNRFMCANPHGDDGAELKRQLVRATLKGCEEIWKINSSARILHCDPLIHVVAPDDRPDLEDHAKMYRQSQFEAWDMLCGRIEPELGGAPHFLDLVGVNYYHSNQWESSGDKWEASLPLFWHLDHPRRVPLYDLLNEVYHRYHRPLLISETSHVGSGRGAWIKEVAQHAVIAQQSGVDLHGICLYPIVDRPDWDNPEHWHKSGLWEVNIEGEKEETRYQRVLSQIYAAGLRDAQRLTHNLFSHCLSIQTPPNTPGVPMTTIIVFSHLRWDFVYQRPQHLLSRLAENYKIVFIEEPILHQHDSFLEYSQPLPNITVVKPHTPVAASGFHDEQLPHLIKLMRQFIVLEEEHIAWFYTPMALPLLRELQPSLVIYDCMDELASFKNPPKQMLQRENALLRTADLVFTGGPSLYRAKRSRHPNVHCFPSSVDIVHFEQARDRSNRHPAHENIPGPRLGYYGVIDERIDLELIDRLAEAHPQWQIVLVGPVAKISRSALPRRHNIHYLGQQPYKALPHFLAGWNVCLLPFALNESTRFISPTKTLEYMAAELPIVSTPVADVVELYGEVVSIADTPQAFIRACENALLTTPEDNTQTIMRMRKLVSATSWNTTAEKMHELMQTAALQTEGSTRGVRRFTEPESLIHQNIEPAPVENRKCVIIGAGPTGLSAAYHLDEETLLLDKNSIVGGWCRSIEDKGFTFDHAGHIMFSNDPYVHQLYKILLGDNVHWQNREAWVYSKGVHTRYPFQGALYGLPADVIKECIVGAMEARYGALKTPQAKSMEGTCQGTDGAAAAVSDCCADGTGSIAPESGKVRSTEGVVERSKVENFENFIYRVWGPGIAKHFAIPYNRKLWTVPLTEMETSWLGGRVPLPDLEEIIEGALRPVAKPMGPNARFGYPLRGGFQAMMSGFVPHIKGTIEVNADVARISPDQHLVTLADGRRYRYQHLVSTMPLPELIRRMGDEAPPSIKKAAAALRHVSVRCVNLGIGRENISDKHWIYYPEDTIFHRVFLQGNASPACNPPGGFGLTCEISYSPAKPLPLDGQELIDRCVEDCIKVGLFTQDDQLITANLVDMPYAYVVYDHARKQSVETIRQWLSERDIILAGRYSEWEYYNSDHAFLAGKKAAEAISQLIDGEERIADKTAV